MKNNILVLGAGALQVPLINKVKGKGYNPVVVSLHADEPGMQIVNDTIIADFCDEELMLKFAKQYDVAGLVTDQTDLPVRTIAYVTEKMGLPSIGYDVACTFTDKFRMREKCKSLGIKTLEYKLVNSLEEARAFVKKIDKEVILKPINNQGSKGVYKVSSMEELDSKFAEVTKYARGEGILIEEFVAGEELVIEGMALDGVYENLICGDTYYFDIPDAFSAKQRIFPTRKGKEIVNQALDINKRIMKGFGLPRGLTHGEYIISDGTVYLLEIAARGGGVYISSDIIPLMTGFDTTSFIIDIATKSEVDWPIFQDQSKVVCYVAFFLPEGVVSEALGMEQVRSLPFVYHNNLSSIVKGRKIGRSIDKTSRFFMVVEASSYQEMDDRIDMIKGMLDVQVDNGRGREGIIWA